MRGAIELLGAAAIFLLALLSPIEMGDADPAMALLAAQALVEHGTLDLGVYRGDPDLYYDLEGFDYRVRRRGDGVYYFNLGVPVVSAPFVWLANRLGYDMLERDDELALQNLLSALLTALVFVLLYRLARVFTAPAPSLAIALVTHLGSSLSSTLASGLWSTDYQVVLLCGVLLVVAARRDATLSARELAWIAVLLAVAFVIRPTTAFLGLAVLAHLAFDRRRAVATSARVVLGAGAVIAVLALLRLLPWLPRYYSPRKVAGFELYGVLASPSRGLLVFSPFLLPVLLALAARFRALSKDPLARMVALWIALHVAAVAAKGTWWGGQSFGPRLMTEAMPGFVVLTAWAWSRLATSRRRGVWAGAYLALGLAGVLIHSYQGLFNPATQRWDREPNIDNPRYHELLFDWRYPQFLATDAAVEERWLDFRRRAIGVYRPGTELGHDSPDLVYVHWHEPEAGWRWSRRYSTLLFRLAADDAEGAHVLELHGATLGDQEVLLELNDRFLGGLRFGHAPARRSLEIPAGALRAGENRLLLHVPGAGTAPGDTRELGLALRSFELTPQGPRPREGPR